jgi:hypothetical protein
MQADEYEANIYITQVHYFIGQPTSGTSYRLVYHTDVAHSSDGTHERGEAVAAGSNRW